GANQTTRQAGMFRSLVRLAVDLPAPTADEATALELRTIVSTAARALAAATGEHPGPVHLNLSFRDPLVPRPRTDDPAPLAETPAQRIVLTRRAGTGPAAPHPVPVDDRTVWSPGTARAPRPPSSPPGTASRCWRSPAPVPGTGRPSCPAIPPCCVR